MEKYLWETYCNEAYLLKQSVDYIKQEEYIYYVEYPIKHDNIWRFCVTTEDLKTGYAETECWELSEKEQTEIKEYIRNVLHPVNFYESEVDK